jgi:hypothetical protein
MNRLLFATVLLAGCSEPPEPMAWERAQVLAKRCEAMGLKPAYQRMNPLSLIPDKSGGAIRWVQCIDPATGALFNQSQE